MKDDVADLFGFSVDEPAFWEGYVTEDRRLLYLQLGQGCSETHRDSDALSARVREKLYAELALSKDDEMLLAGYELPGFRTAGLLDYRLLGWSSFVLEVEELTLDSPDEYLYELMDREVLQGIMELSRTLRDRLTPIIGPWDERFCQVTIPTHEPLSGRGDGWWWHRFPLRCPSSWGGVEPDDVQLWSF
jgi:hypothetical protein